MSFHSDLIMKLGGMQPDPFEQCWAWQCLQGNEILDLVRERVRTRRSSNMYGRWFTQAQQEFRRAIEVSRPQ